MGNNLILLCVIVAASSVRAIPVPQDLSIAEFRSLRDENTPARQVFMSPSYAQVRRQGRNFGTGEIFSFKRPLPVRNIAASGRALSPSRKELKRVEAAPVFNLNDMLKKEAAKLKAKVQEASLAAAKAAEEAEQKLEEMVEKVMVETDATREEVEKIIEEAIEESEVEDEIFGAEKSSNSDKKDKEELSKEIINLINDNDEPSKDIDLGSVQEVWFFLNYVIK